MTGLLTGVVVGVGVGLFFAPTRGSALRRQVAEQAGSFAKDAADGVRKATENVSGWTDRGREIYGKAKDAVANRADEAQQYVRDTASRVKQVAS